MIRLFVRTALLTIVTSPLNAQSSSTCVSPAHQQFDFWIGSWDVFNRHGQRLGTNRIEKTLDGCAVHESWSSAEGVRGHSYAAWDVGDNLWHLTWVDNTGTVLRLAGGIVNGRMVMEGDRRLPDGTPVTERITWIPIADSGSVYQSWESSRDRGMRWTTTFYGFYRKRSPGS